LADSSEDLQFRDNEDKKVHCWRMGDKIPAEARRDTCPRCKVKLKVTIYEFPGGKGELELHYKCPKCDEVDRVVKGQRLKYSGYDFKEPEQPNK